MGSMGSLRQQSRGPTSNKVDIASKDRDVRCFFAEIKGVSPAFGFYLEGGLI